MAILPTAGAALWRGKILAIWSRGLAYALIPLREATEGVNGACDLGPRGAYIWRSLANGLCYPLELAEALGCGRPIITAELARLAEAGLSIGPPGEKDRRRSELKLTELGQEETEKLRQKIWRIVTANLAGYTPDEIRKFAVMSTGAGS
jgi:DNA-binding MarR family transcriptional regulator